MSTHNRVIIVYSGGLDSYTLLHLAQKKGLTPIALTVHYGQRHAREILIAQKVCVAMDIEHIMVDLTQAALATMAPAAHSTDSATSLLAPQLLEKENKTITQLPLNKYSDENMALTVVPNRNMVLLSFAIASAVSRKIPQVWYGAHGSDAHTYPDCRPIFVKAMQQAAALCDNFVVNLKVPWLHKSKTEVVAEGLTMNLDYSQTYSCYLGEERSCGKCGACCARLQAFTENNAIDPLDYQT